MSIQIVKFQEFGTSSVPALYGGYRIPAIMRLTPWDGEDHSSTDDRANDRPFVVYDLYNRKWVPVLDGTARNTDVKMYHVIAQDGESGGRVHLYTTGQIFAFDRYRDKYCSQHPLYAADHAAVLAAITEFINVRNATDPLD